MHAVPITNPLPFHAACPHPTCLPPPYLPAAAHLDLPARQRAEPGGRSTLLRSYRTLAGPGTQQSVVWDTGTHGGGCWQGMQDGCRGWAAPYIKKGGRRLLPGHREGLQGHSNPDSGSVHDGASPFLAPPPLVHHARHISPTNSCRSTVSLLRACTLNPPLTSSPSTCH
jgi:hypothetical protein